MALEDAFGENPNRPIHITDLLIPTREEEGNEPIFDFNQMTESDVKAKMNAEIQDASNDDRITWALAYTIIDRTKEIIKADREVEFGHAMRLVDETISRIRIAEPIDSMTSSALMNYAAKAGRLFPEKYLEIVAKLAPHKANLLSTLVPAGLTYLGDKWVVHRDYYMFYGDQEILEQFDPQIVADRIQVWKKADGGINDNTLDDYTSMLASVRILTPDWYRQHLQPTLDWEQLMSLYKARGEAFVNDNSYMGKLISPAYNLTLMTAPTLPIGTETITFGPDVSLEETHPMPLEKAY